MPGSFHLSFFVFRQSCQWSYQNQLSFSGKDSTADFFKMTKNENQNMGWKAQKWHFDWNYGWQKSFSFGFLKIGCPFFKNIKKWLCSTKLRNDCVPLNWALRNDLCSPKLRNDCVPLNCEMTVFPLNWEMTVFHRIEKWLCWTKLRMTVFHRIEKRLCSTKLKMTIFNKIEKWLCSTKLRYDCVPRYWKMREMTVFHHN